MNLNSTIYKAGISAVNLNKLFIFIILTKYKFKKYNDIYLTIILYSKKYINNDAWYGMNVGYKEFGYLVIWRTFQY